MKELQRRSWKTLNRGFNRKASSFLRACKGIIEAMGVKLSVNYLAAENSIDICIIETPAFIPSSVVWAQVERVHRSRIDGFEFGSAFRALISMIHGTRCLH